MTTLLNLIESLYQQYLLLVKANPVVATVVSMGALASITFFLKDLPRSLLSFARRQFTTTLTLTNCEYGTNHYTFIAFMEWFNNSRWARWSRTYMIDGAYQPMAKGWTRGTTTVGVGLGQHFFFYRGRLCWMTRQRLGDGQHGHKITYEITIQMLGRNRPLLMELIDEFKWKPIEDSVGIFKPSQNGWAKMCDIPKRDLSTVFLDPDIKAHFCRQIESFQSEQSWFKDRGLPWKKTFLLEGPPGSGKTSLIKSLASHYGFNLCIMNLNEISDHYLEDALSSAPDRSFIVMEDFDDAVGDLKRSHISTIDDCPKPLLSEVPQTTTVALIHSNSSPKKELKFLTLSGLLNALDGLISLDGKIIILTTNDISRLDAALLRKGRVDHHYYLGRLKHGEVKGYVEMMFPGNTVREDIVFDEIMGCDLQAIYFEYRSDFDTFVNHIPSTNRISDIHYSNVATIAR